MNIRILLMLVACASLQISQSAKILGVFPLGGKSLNILYNKLMIAVANAGHEVTVISAHEPKTKLQNGSMRHFELTGVWEKYDAQMAKMDAFNIKEHSNLFGSIELTDFQLDVSDAALGLPALQALFKSNETFDAMIIENIWTDNFKILGQIFNCPVIMFSSIGGNNPWVNAEIGNPLPPSYVPHFHMVGDNFNGMNFFRRVQNSIIFLSDTLVKYYYAFPIYNRILQTHFKNPPDVWTFYNNISLVLLGSHSSLRQAAPLLPNVVEIGGFHIDPPKKLPKDIQDFLDGATEGAIYFSLGSHVYSKDMPAAMKKMFLDVFGKLKQRVLWKFEEDLPDKPDNVFINTWLPQTDILAHPNMKLFITHGGYGSLLETVYHGVPCVMVPIFFDQFNNAYQAVQYGIALKLTLNEINEATLMQAIKELLDNPNYRNNVKKRQLLYHDRPLKPLDAAIYWIEYVARHKGADHLKVAGMNMPWYQLYSIDVVMFLLALFFVVLYSAYLVLRKISCPRKHVQKQKIH